jgi:hypothetical protein
MKKKTSAKNRQPTLDAAGGYASTSQTTIEHLVSAGFHS